MVTLTICVMSSCRSDTFTFYYVLYIHLWWFNSTYCSNRTSLVSTFSLLAFFTILSDVVSSDFCCGINCFATRIFYENSVNISLPSLWIKLAKVTTRRPGKDAKYRWDERNWIIPLSCPIIGKSVHNLWQKSQNSNLRKY